MPWNAVQIKGGKSLAVTLVSDPVSSKESKGELDPALIQVSRICSLAGRQFRSIFIRSEALDFSKIFFLPPPPLRPLKLGPQEYFKGNSIHMCLIRVHLTHWHVVFQELIDVQGVSWPLFLSLAALPFSELENRLLLEVSSAFQSWKFGAQLDTQFPNLRRIRGLTNVASIYKTLSCFISSSSSFFSLFHVWHP